MEQSNTGSRGQVGIGTLIVFIALVLVAGISAGVLLDTAGLLQKQAETTGEESTEQVVSTPQIMHVTAETTQSGGEAGLTKFEVTLQTPPGTDYIEIRADGSKEHRGVLVNPEGMELQAADLGSTITFGYASTFFIADGGGVDTDIGDVGGENALPEGNSIEFIFKSTSGGRLVVDLTAPDTISSDGERILLE